MSLLATDQLLSFSLASLALIFTPGPDIIYVLTRGVAQGRGAALAAAAGFALGNFVHTFAAVIGLSALIVSSATAFTLIRWAGAAYLIYLGIQLFRAPGLAPAAKGAPGDRGPMDALPLGRIFRQSVIANILNPKVAVFFLAFFPQFVRPEQGQPALQILLLGTTFVCLTLLGFGCIALASGAINGWLATRPGVSGKLHRVAGSILVLLGLSLALPDSR